MGKYLFFDIFGANWDSWQDFAFIAMIAFAALLLLFIVIFVILKNPRMDEDSKRIIRRVEHQEKEIEAKRKVLVFERAKHETKLEENFAKIKEREEAAEEAAAATDEMRVTLRKKEQEIEALLKTAEMTKRELAEYQKREGTQVSEDVAVNALTERVISESKLEADSRFQDCKIPAGRNLVTFDNLVEYISDKAEVTFAEAVGQKPANYKVDGRTFALLYKVGNHVKMTFKCGPAYGSKLCKYLPQNVSASKFPYGLLWFTVSNEYAVCSREIFRQLVDISYKIAKFGY